MRQEININLNKRYVKKIFRCRSCKSKKIIPVLSLGEQYLSDFYKGNKKPKRFPLEIVLCTKCSLVQLLHTISPEVLYHKRYGYKSGINQTMKNELRDVVEKSQKLVKSKQKYTVLDIGANDGTLLGYYSKNIFRIGVEPIKKFKIELQKTSNVVVNDFFNYKSVIKHSPFVKFHIISAISCFYDIDEPNTFVSDVAKLLHDDGIFVIQQNYLGLMIENRAFDNIVHEHLEYYSLNSLENLLNRHGLEVFHIELRKINGGSFRTYVAHKNKRKINNFSTISIH